MSGWTKDHKSKVANNHCKRLKSDDSNNKAPLFYSLSKDPTPPLEIHPYTTID